MLKASRITEKSGCITEAEGSSDKLGWLLLRNLETQEGFNLMGCVFSKNIREGPSLRDSDYLAAFSAILGENFGIFVLPKTLRTVD